MKLWERAERIVAGRPHKDKGCVCEECCTWYERVEAKFWELVRERDRGGAQERRHAQGAPR